METTAVSSATGSAACSGRGGQRAPHGPRPLEHDLAIAHPSEGAVVERLERVERLAVGLGHVVGGQDQPGHDHDHALPRAGAGRPRRGRRR